MQSAVRFQPLTQVFGMKLPGQQAHSAAQIVGVSAIWRKLMVQAETVAPFIQIAAIEGEQGAGKNTLAKYLHSRSTMASSSFQRYDAREWLVMETDPSALTGFLFLDRVDLLGVPGQRLLLGVLKILQDRPSGRVIILASAENSLRQLAAQGLFMPDLAFRLTAVRFALPPLRQRREDIGPLAQNLLDSICTRYQHRPVMLGPGAMARLLQHSWPGNVRELSSVLEAALVEANNGIIRAQDLPIPVEVEPTLQVHPAPPSQDLSLDAMIRHHVHYVLDLNRGNKLRTARQLRISRSTLYRILGNESILAR
jgi:DNA-binding NtrC family response regulator